MRFIKKWSYACAKYLAEQLEQDHTKRSVYYYGFQLVIGSLVKGSIMVVAALILGSFSTAMTLMLTFILFRILAGGYHMDTYGKCLGASMLLFLIPAVLTQYTYKLWPAELAYIFAALTFVTSLPVILKWAPADTPNKPITKPSQIRRLKTSSALFLVLWLLVTNVLIFNGLIKFAVASSFGILIETFTVTPAGYQFFDRISGKLKNA